MKAQIPYLAKWATFLSPIWVCLLVEISLEYKHGIQSSKKLQRNSQHGKGECFRLEEDYP